LRKEEEWGDLKTLSQWLKLSGVSKKGGTSVVVRGTSPTQKIMKGSSHLKREPVFSVRGDPRKHQGTV